MNTSDASGLRTHLVSIAIGIVLAVTGLILWQTTATVDLPILTLSKVGVVLLVLGLVEILVSGAAAAWPATRHRKFPL